MYHRKCATFQRIKLDLLLLPALCWFCLSVAAVAGPGEEIPQKLGDTDNDGQATVTDVVRFVNHLSGQDPFSETIHQYADVNRDGVVNDDDLVIVRSAILGTAALPDNIARLTETSPANFESGVAVTRETVLRFDQPLDVTGMLAP